MTQLPLPEAIARFKENEERVDVFANGTDIQSYTSTGGDVVSSLQKFLADKDDAINVGAESILALSQASATTATEQADIATAQALAATAAANAAASMAAARWVQSYDISGLSNPITLDVSPVSKSLVDVRIDGIAQKQADFSLTGAQLTFIGGWPVGADNVEIVYYGSVLNRDEAIALVDDINEASAINIMPENTIKGRVTPGTGAPESLSVNAVRALLNVQDGATANLPDAALLERSSHTGTQLAATISDFSAAVASAPSVIANTAKVSNADHTGDVTGSAALTIANDAVNNAKLANMPAKTYKGRTTNSTGDPENVPLATVRADLSIDNVDNTADSAKPVSTAQQTALDLKADLAGATFTGPLVANGAGNIASNTAIGTNALAANVGGTGNTALGNAALQANTSGLGNTATGSGALAGNGTGARNTAIGTNAMSVVDANDNTAIGHSVGNDLTSGTFNTLLGRNTGRGITTGVGNLILGASVTALAAGLTNNIILASGSAGTIRVQFDGTNWTFSGGISSPSLIGVPTAPTASAGTNTTQIATTAFVTAADNLKANLANPTFTGTVTVPTPTVAGAAANKGYVDAVSAGLSPKAPVRVASTANIVIASALINGSTIDGVVVATGDRVLLKNQTTASENGIYVVAASGAASRATDVDISEEMVSGVYTVVTAGTIGGGQGFILATPNPIVLGTTALSFMLFSTPGVILGGAGLVKTGNTLDVVGTTNRIVVAADSVDIGTDVVTLTGSQTLTNKTITSPAGLVKADVGLGSVDNTADSAKPVSTIQQTALNAKVDTTLTISTTAPLAGGGSLTTNRTLTISPATTSAAGSMSAADKTKLNGLTNTVITRYGVAYTSLTNPITLPATPVSTASVLVIIDGIIQAATLYSLAGPVLTYTGGWPLCDNVEFMIFIG